jgi:hypothetical protein
VDAFVSVPLVEDTVEIRVISLFVVVIPEDEVCEKKMVD